LSRLVRAIVIASVALLVLLVTCSPPPPRALFAPAAALQANDAARPLAPRIAGQTRAAQPSPIVQPGAVAQAAGRPAATPIPPTIGPAQPDEPLLGAVDGYLSDIAGAGWFQGAVLVAHNGRVLLDKGYGLADVAQNIPNTPQTRFRLASMTKQFTAMAIMILQSRGKLDVQHSVCDYLADCPEAWRPISIHNLLTHTSGLPNYTDFASYDATQMLPATPDELVARFRDQPLLFAPGTQYMYENSDYVLLGLIVERVSGQSYDDFLRAAIFAPLGMRDSGVDHSAGAIVGGAQGYGGGGELAPFLDTSTLFAAGSLFSTVEDLYRWDQALYTTKLLPQPLLDAMWTPYLNDYAYGWRVSSLDGHRQISHPGLIDGFATAIVRLPDDHLTVIVLSNTSSADALGIAQYLAGMLLNS
jgi:CubicO group peptidase (beta-lactamase class C family)